MYYSIQTNAEINSSDLIAAHGSTDIAFHSTVMSQEIKKKGRKKRGGRQKKIERKFDDKEKTPITTLCVTREVYNNDGILVDSFFLTKKSFNIPWSFPFFYFLIARM